MSIRVACEECGKEFDCCPSRYKERKHLFCSVECFSKYTKAHNPNYIPCEVCGKLVYAKPWYRNKTRHICCSMECSAKIRKILYSGEGNHQYGLKGKRNASWKSDEHMSCGYIIERSPNHPFKEKTDMVPQHRLVAEKHLLTDKNSVEVDGKRYLSPKYHVHHIDLHKDNNDPSNLLVVTKPQHMKLHSMLNETERDEKTGRIVSMRLAKDFRTPEEILEITDQFINEYLGTPTVMAHSQIPKEG